MNDSEKTNRRHFPAINYCLKHSVPNFYVLKSLAAFMARVEKGVKNVNIVNTFSQNYYVNDGDKNSNLLNKFISNVTLMGIIPPFVMTKFMSLYLIMNCK